MPFSIRPYRRFPVHCSVTYNAGPFLKLPPAYCSGFWLPITLLVLSSGPACVFQTKLDTRSTANWTAIPEQTGQ
jgi:hypothetical protein